MFFFFQISILALISAIFNIRGICDEKKNILKKLSEIQWNIYTESYLFLFKKEKKKIVMVRLFLNLFHVVPHFEGGPSSILLFFPYMMMDRRGMRCPPPPPPETTLTKNLNNIPHRETLSVVVYFTCLTNTYVRIRSKTRER